MAQHHWIITNRRVRRRRQGDHFVERVDVDDQTAYPVFRVATFDAAAPGASLNDEEALLRRVAFIKDEFVQGYESLAASDDPAQYNGTRHAFLQIYQRMMEAPPGRGDVLFFIHGFQTGWVDAVRHLQKLHALYGADACSTIDQIVLFSWPSHDSLLRYKADAQVAQLSGQVLGRLFGKVLRFYEDVFERETNPFERCGHRIHLMAHSMGNWVLENFIAAIERYFRHEVFGEILLMNADVSWTALEAGQPMHHLPTFGERIHVYNNGSDDALRVSHHTKNGRKRLGRQGPRDKHTIPPRTLIVDTTQADFHGGDVKDVPDDDPFYQAAERVLDVMPPPRAGRRRRERIVDHWGYLFRPVVIADVMAVLSGQSSSRIETRRHRDGPLFAIAE